MKKQVIVLFVLLSLNLFAQKTHVKYTISENTNDAVLATIIDYNLIMDGNQSIYFNSTDSLNQFKYRNGIFDIDKIGELTRVKLTDNHYAFVKQDYFYKNYQLDTLLFNEIILHKKVIVGEKINLFDWEIAPKSDTIILGFKCQKATTLFRGRIYEAYFSSDIAPNGGPWKFDGLPGLILSIRSKDGYLNIEPTKVVTNYKENIDIKNIYEKESIISWTDFKKNYETKLKEQLKKLKSLSEDGEGGSIKISDKLEDLEIPEMKF